jgi:hypothetical protein
LYLAYQKIGVFMSDNPLRQYFRRPAVYLKLPSGGIGYSPGSIDMPETGEIPIYPMTAIDEITARTPDALYNGTAVVEILRSCVPNIKNPWEVTNVDLDPLLVAIRAATHGSKMEIETDCPECKETSKYDVDLGGVLADFKPGDYSSTLNLGEIQIKFRPLRFTEMNEANLAQFQVQRGLQDVINSVDDELKNQKTTSLLKTINDMTMNVIASTIEYIKTPGSTTFEREFIIEFLQNIDKKTYDTIQEKTVKLRQSTENKPLHITCSHCQHDYEQSFSVNVTDFFE